MFFLKKSIFFLSVLPVCLSAQWVQKNTLSRSNWTQLYETFSTANGGSGTIGEYGWVRASLGSVTGATNVQTADPNEPDGYYVLSSGTTSNTGQVIYLGNHRNVGYIEIWARVRFTSLTNAIYNLGLADGVGGSPGNSDHMNNGIEIIFDSSQSGSILFASENGAGNRTVVDTGFQPSTVAWYNFRIVLLKDKAFLYINGEVAAQIDNNIVVDTADIRPLFRVNTLDSIEKQLLCGHFEMRVQHFKGMW